VECEDVRAALSARLDGEPAPPGTDEDAVDAHLAACDDCQAWYASVSALNRRLRIGGLDGPVGRASGDGDGDAAGAADARSLAERMVELADSTPQLSHGLRNRSLPLVVARIVLVVLAVLYVAWAVALLVGATGDGASAATGSGGAVGNAGDPDLARMSVDAATVRFALAAGLVLGAVRPRWASGLLPVFVALWGFGAGFSTRDLVLGYLDTGAVLGLLLHLAASVTLCVVWLARHHAVNPLRQSLRGLGARPVAYSPSDAVRNSTWRPGDPDGL
jgi:predicted anti-sigma-YlaC factor YlaD